MGLEDFTIRMLPTRQEITGAEVKETLIRHRFKTCSTKLMYSGVCLGKPIRDEDFLCYKASDGVVEALIKLDTAPPHSKLLYVSLRMAVCQPATAALWFIHIARLVAMHHQLEIHAGELRFGETNVKSEFSKAAQREIRERKLRWQSLFEFDRNEPVVSPSQAWEFFFKLHPAIRAASSGSISNRNQ